MTQTDAALYENEGVEAMITEENVMVQPRNGLVLITREKIEKTEQGIILPGGSYCNFEMARVIRVGPGSPSDTGGRCDDASDLQEGMRVIVKASSPASRNPNQLQQNRGKEYLLPITINGEKVEMINQHDIIAIITEGETNGVD